MYIKSIFIPLQWIAATVAGVALDKVGGFAQ